MSLRPPHRYSVDLSPSPVAATPDVSEDVAAGLVDGCVVVTPTGDLDVATSPALRARAHQRIDDGASLVVLDLSGVNFLDSTALGVLVSVHKRLLELGGRLAVVCPHARIRRIFDFTGLNRVLTLTDSVDAAIIALKHGGPS